MYSFQDACGGNPSVYVEKSLDRPRVICFNPRAGRKGLEVRVMVAIVAGDGRGLFNTSLNTVGAAGVLGRSVLGQGSSRAIVNVVNGNLVLQTQDVQLAGRGMDLFAL